MAGFRREAWARRRPRLGRRGARPTRSVLALPLIAMVAVGLALPAQARSAPALSIHAAPTQSLASDPVRSLIVQYESGYQPKPGSVLGSSKVTGAQRANLKLGPALGQRMWRVDFKVPVSTTVATRVAHQLATHPAVAFAEIDRPVSVTS